MAKRIRKAVKYGAQLAMSAAGKIKREIKALVKAGIIDRKEAKKILNAFTSDLRAEKSRLVKFAKQETKRMMNKAKARTKPLVKKALKRIKTRHKR